MRYDEATPPTDDPLFPFTAGVFGSGANMAFRRRALDAIGGFDRALGAGTPARGGDDLATFFDVITAGYALVYEPDAIVFHSHRPDYASLRRQAFGYGVGMGAYAAHVLTTHPGRALRSGALVGTAARRYFGAHSPKNARRPADFPRELVWRERAGVVVGPWRYWRSRRATDATVARRRWTTPRPRPRRRGTGACPVVQPRPGDSRIRCRTNQSRASCAARSSVPTSSNRCVACGMTASSVSHCMRARRRG